MKYKVFAGLLLLVFGTALSAKEIGETKPEREGLSSDRLSRITDFMDEAVKRETMVGGMGLVARNGKVVYETVYGMADREAGLPMTDDTIFRIYSMSKPVTSVALMMLYEEGKFHLNDPIHRYMPEFKGLQVALSTGEGVVTSDGTAVSGVAASSKELEGKIRPVKKAPTVRDLLRHTAGFTYGIFGNTEVDRQYMQKIVPMMASNATLADFTKTLATIPLQYEPGTQYHYSVSVDVQGRLIEVLSGMKFGDFLEERLFKPLGMTDTGFGLAESKQGRLAQLYQPKGVTGLYSKPTGPGLEPAAGDSIVRYIENESLQSGGGGLLSTTRDYLRFCQMLLNGGELHGARILSPTTINLMTENHLAALPQPGYPGFGFGLGFGIQTDPAVSADSGSKGVYSWGGIAGTRFWIDPIEQMIGIFMVQSVPHRTRLASDFKNLVYQAVTESYAD